MKPIPVKQPPFRQNRKVMMLDDPEMALELTDFANTTTLKDGRWVSAPPARLLSPDFLTELHSAASMIMDREECEALQSELGRIQNAGPLAA
jgi:hypothetical protein